MIIEIGVDIQSEGQLHELEIAICKLGLPYYIEPNNNFNSLEDLECQCEGK